MRLREKWDGKLTSTDINVTFDEHYDVIVVGLGTAGVYAAITAARKGLKVLGIERLNSMGGTGTTGGVVGYYYGNRGGTFETVDQKVSTLQRQDDFVPFMGGHSELKSWVMDTEARKAGVHVNFESYVIGLYLEDSTVKGLKWVSQSGEHHTSAKVVIDSTGNAEVSEMAGCALNSGRNIDETCQPFSNVQMRLYPNGKVGNFYTDSGYLDISDSEDLTRAIFESNLLGTHLQEKYTNDSLILKTCQLLGIRESRHIVGEECVTFADFIEGRITEQPVFVGFSNLDNHGKDMAFESEIQQDWLVGASMFGPCFNVPIPMGALIPKGYNGLLVAGRCISLDHDIASAIRQKRDMQKSGETAANMAYISISKDVPLKGIQYQELLSLQTETGCLKLNQTLDFNEMSPAESNDQVVVPAMKWLTELNDIKDGLNSDKAGRAIWSAKRLGDSIAETLQDWMHTQDEGLLRKNCALALGLMGNPVCLPVLREIVYQYDLYLPKTSRKYNQPHFFAAVHLLGRLKDQQIMPELLSIIEDDSFLEKLEIDKRNDEFIFDRNELYFQFFSFSMIAVLKIAEAHPEWRPKVMELIDKRLADTSLVLEITLKSHIIEAKGFLNQPMKKRTERIYQNYISKWN
jgi:hypothetical protein